MNSVNDLGGYTVNLLESRLIRIQSLRSATALYQRSLFRYRECLGFEGVVSRGILAPDNEGLLVEESFAKTCLEIVLTKVKYVSK